MSWTQLLPQGGEAIQWFFPCTLNKLGGKKARKWHRERNKTGKIVSVGARSGCDAHKYGDHAEVVVLGSADVGPCPQISAFQQAIKQ